MPLLALEAAGGARLRSALVLLKGSRVDSADVVISDIAVTAAETPKSAANVALSVPDGTPRLVPAISLAVANSDAPKPAALAKPSGLLPLKGSPPKSPKATSDAFTPLAEEASVRLQFELDDVGTTASCRSPAIEQRTQSHQSNAV